MTCTVVGEEVGVGVAQGIPYTLQEWTYHLDRGHHIDHWREEGRRERRERRERGGRGRGGKGEGGGEKRGRGGEKEGLKRGEGREGGKRGEGGGEREGEGHIIYNNTVIIIQTLVYLVLRMGLNPP